MTMVHFSFNFGGHRICTKLGQKLHLHVFCFAHAVYQLADNSEADLGGDKLADIPSVPGDFCFGNLSFISLILTL